MHKKRFPHLESKEVKLKGSEYFEDLFTHQLNSTDAWFLGPKAENTELLVELISQAIESIEQGRKEFHPEDKSAIKKSFKEEEEYKKAVELLKKNFSRLTSFLDEYDTPFYSHRYQGHMNWELTLPSVAGYFAAMLHNPNNVTVQASTATTYLELALGRDICRMIGMTKSKPRPWSHITCDGTIANIESVWSARELKYFPFAVKDAFSNNEFDAKPEELVIVQPNGTEKPLTEFSNWELFNITNDEILRIPYKISNISNKHEEDCWNILLHNYSLNALGFAELENRHRTNCNPSIAVPSTKHYSWTKAASVLGLGHGSAANLYDKGLINVFVDEKARMDLEQLSDVLDYCSNPENNRPLMLLTAVMGSTEESAVDPLRKILELREEYRKEKNFDFNIHADAAFGGYCITAIRKDFPISGPFDKESDDEETDLFIDDYSKTALSSYVVEQMKQIRNCDSVTIDPHKWAYVPYPAGSLTYRNEAIINLVSFGAPYIGDEKKHPSVGGFGLEGSKPGASATSVFFSHSIIRPSISGYGRILSNCLINARLFYISLLNMEQTEDNFFVVPLSGIDDVSGSERKTLEYISENLHGKKHEHIFSDNELYGLFRDIGPDQNMVDYIFNFYTDNKKTPNTDIQKLNELNNSIYNELHIHEGNPTPQIEMAISMTTFSRDDYGDKFINNLAVRLKIVNPQDITEINCLRSTVMNPWLAETDEQHMNFFEQELIPVLRKTVNKCLKNL